MVLGSIYIYTRIILHTYDYLFKVFVCLKTMTCDVSWDIRDWAWPTPNPGGIRFTCTDRIRTSLANRSARRTCTLGKMPCSNFKAIWWWLPKWVANGYIYILLVSCWLKTINGFCSFLFDVISAIHNSWEWAKTTAVGTWHHLNWWFQWGCSPPVHFQMVDVPRFN